MKINKNSWHYKLLTEHLGFYLGKYSNWSLCRYFWTVVFAIPVFIFIILPGIAFIKLNDAISTRAWYVSIIVFTTMFWYSLFFLLGYNIEIGNAKPLIFTPEYTHYTAGLEMSIILGTAVNIASLFMILVVYNENHYKYREKKKKPLDVEDLEKMKDKQPNILIEFLKARKNKICPLVTFVDPDSEKDIE